MNINKIYTLTFHAADNYGAVWQAFALQYYLKTLGVKTQCIDYKPNYFDYNVFSLSKNKATIKNIIQTVITLPTRIIRRIYFYKFRKAYIDLYSSPDYRKDINAVFIVGSDQVWNKCITGGELDANFFLEGVLSSKKYSYAASIGYDTIHNIQEVYEKLTNFRGIGVRELSVYEILSTKNDNRIIWNVDPVFLLSSDVYLNMTNYRVRDKYVLIYTLETNITGVRDVIKKYKSTHKVISIGSFRNIYGSDVHYRCASPIDFIGLISNADVVISNSFHTVAFSIIFNRTIEYIPLKNGRGGRIQTLFSLIGNEGNFCISSKCDKTQLNQLIKNSKNYLERIIRA